MRIAAFADDGVTFSLSSSLTGPVRSYVAAADEPVHACGSGLVPPCPVGPYRSTRSYAGTTTSRSGVGRADDGSGSTTAENATAEIGWTAPNAPGTWTPSSTA